MKKAAKETVETGWQIVLGKGSTEFGVASAAAAITRAILGMKNGRCPARPFSPVSMARRVSLPVLCAS